MGNCRYLDNPKIQRYNEQYIVNNIPEFVVNTVRGKGENGMCDKCKNWEKPTLMRSLYRFRYRCPECGAVYRQTWRIGKHNIITPVMFLSLISAAAFLRLPVIPWLLPFPPYHFVDHMLTRESFLFYYPFLVIYAFCLFYFLLNLIVYLFSHYERLEKGEY